MQTRLVTANQQYQATSPTATLELQHLFRLLQSHEDFRLLQSHEEDTSS